MAIRCNSIDEAAAALKAGDAAIFPTETVFGLGVSVLHAPSPEILYELKRREKRKPISWLISSIDDLDVYGRVVPDFAKVLAKTFWPGPLTLIVRASDAVPQAFQSDQATIGLRMPDNACALQLIERVGCPLATTSANIAGEHPASCVDELDAQLAQRVGVVVAGDVGSGTASTVVDCTHEHPTLMRVGAITLEDIQALL